MDTLGNTLPRQQVENTNTLILINRFQQELNYPGGPIPATAFWNALPPMIPLGRRLKLPTSTYDQLTQGRRFERFLYSIQGRVDLTARRLYHVTFYHDARPLSQSCLCQHWNYRNAIHWVSETEIEEYQRIRAVHRRAAGLGANSYCARLFDGQLVDIRQARALVSLGTSDSDVEIAKRVLEDPAGWGSVGCIMRSCGWVDDVEIAGCDYVLQ